MKIGTGMGDTGGYQGEEDMHAISGVSGHRQPETGGHNF